MMHTQCFLDPKWLVPLLLSTDRGRSQWRTLPSPTFHEVTATLSKPLFYLSFWRLPFQHLQLESPTIMAMIHLRNTQQFYYSNGHIHDSARMADVDVLVAAHWSRFGHPASLFSSPI
jgi:hypothetical protein